MKRINRMWVKESGGKHLLHRREVGFTWTPELDETGEVTNLDQLQAYMEESGMTQEAKNDLDSALIEFMDKGGKMAVTRKTPWRFSFKLWKREK